MIEEKPIEKKRSTKVIALAIISIILAASTVGLSGLYVNNQSQVTEKDNTIASLNTQIESLQTQLSQVAASSLSQKQSLEQQITEYNSSLAELNTAYTNLQSIVQLRDTGTLYTGSFNQTASTNSTLYEDTVNYAGYVIVTATSNSSTTFVSVGYTFASTNFNYNQTLGTSGTAIFPVLPSTLQIIIGNRDSTDVNSVNATAVYHY
jgi:hypothetical protein